jgi:hypothetical protein
MTEQIEKSLLEIDFASLSRRTFTPSPAAWEDQVLFFLLLDRFSDGKETDGYRDNDDHPVRTGATPLYRPEDAGLVNYDTWFRAGAGHIDGVVAEVRHLQVAEQQAAVGVRVVARRAAAYSR